MEVDNVEKGLFGRAKMAKLEKSHLTMPSVELKFGLQIDNPKQRLLELNDDLLAKIEAGEDIFVSSEITIIKTKILNFVDKTGFRFAVKTRSP